LHALLELSEKKKNAVGKKKKKIVPPAYEGQMFACNKDDPGVSVYFP